MLFLLFGWLVGWCDCLNVTGALIQLCKYSLQVSAHFPQSFAVLLRCCCCCRLLPLLFIVFSPPWEGFGVCCVRTHSLHVWGKGKQNELKKVELWQNLLFKCNKSIVFSITLCWFCYCAFSFLFIYYFALHTSCWFLCSRDSYLYLINLVFNQHICIRIYLNQIYKKSCSTLEESLKTYRQLKW